VSRLGWLEVVDHCLAKPGAWADTPWEGDQVAKVHDKVFTFLGAQPLPGEPAHIGRSGWNRLRIGYGVPDDELLEAVDESYARIVARLPRKHRPAGWDDVAAVGHV
jgi:predicted DNA-binding protein (MmcQ/YjbR family)